MVDIKLYADLGKSFDLAIDSVCMRDPQYAALGPEFVAFAKSNEVRPKTLQNLANQVKIYEAKYPKRQGEKALFDRNGLIAATALLYVQAIKMKRDRDTESQAARSVRLKEKDTREEVAKHITELPHASGQTQN